MQQEKGKDLELREQVAIACGWTQIRFMPKYNIWGFLSEQSDALNVIPQYELSIDAIAEEFDKKEWNYNLSNLQAGDKYLAESGGSNPIEVEAETAAIALCKLFLELCEEEK